MNSCGVNAMVSPESKSATYTLTNSIGCIFEGSKLWIVLPSWRTASLASILNKYQIKN